MAYNPLMEVQGHPVASLHHAFPAKSTAPLLRLRSPLLPYSRHLNFLITECPTPTHLAHYVRTLRAAGVTDVVKVCDASYDHEVLERQFIQVHTLNYPDDGGRPPTPAVVETWLNLVRRRASQAEAMGHHFPPDAPYRQTIAIHCVAGLGRAPLLVALALVDAGMTPMEAVKLVQRKRRGALYNHHVDYVVQFARQRQLELTGETSCQWSKRGLHRTLLTRCRSLCRLVKTKGPQRSAVLTATESTPPSPPNDGVSYFSQPTGHMASSWKTSPLATPTSLRSCSPATTLVSRASTATATDSSDGTVRSKTEPLRRLLRSSSFLDKALYRA